MSQPKLVLRESLYIPVTLLDTEDLEEKYTRHMYDDTICRQCEYFHDRHCDMCDSCEFGGLKETLTFFKYGTFGGTQYMGLPLGDRLNIEQKARIDYDEFKFVDKRTDNKFDYPVKFTGKLRDYQMPLFNGYKEARHGIIKAPPRTGKTVTSLAILIALGRRAIIVADQVDFLQNFMEELEQYTNLPKLSEKAGKKLYGFLDKPEDYKNFQIGFATYQSFISKGNGAKRLKLLNKNFGSVWTDEIHKGNATVFSQFISSTRCKFRGGCTATPKRKDCLPAGSLVAMSDGTFRPIEDVHIGDMVRSFNHTIGEIEDQLVVETHKVNTTKRLVDIEHEHGVLTVTEDHEVWSETRQAYVKAIDLTVDDVLKLF